MIFILLLFDCRINTPLGKVDSSVLLLFIQEMAQTAAISNRVRYKPQYLMEKPTPLQRDSLGIELAQILFEVAIRLETSNMSYHSLQNVGAKLRITEQRTK